jgi:hypothetical protein
MRGERQIRRKWPAIYTFSGKGQMEAKGCGLRFAVCQLQIALLLPAVYFVVEIASMC